MSLPTKFDSTKPGACSQFRLAQPDRLHQRRSAKLAEYKVTLLAEFSKESKAFRHFVGLAVNEAASLAWSTPFAHWLLPALAEEKIRYARQWASLQYRVGNGLAADASTQRHEVIRANELMKIHPPDTLATGRVPRSSEAASRAFGAARSGTRP